MAVTVLACFVCVSVVAAAEIAVRAMKPVSQEEAEVLDKALKSERYT